MFNELPETVKQEILHYLETNNFVAAKKIRDDYLASR